MSFLNPYKSSPPPPPPPICQSGYTPVCIKRNHQTGKCEYITCIKLP